MICIVATKRDLSSKGSSRGGLPLPLGGKLPFLFAPRNSFLQTPSVVRSLILSRSISHFLVHSSSLLKKKKKKKKKSEIFVHRENHIGTNGNGRGNKQIDTNVIGVIYPFNAG